MRKILIFTFLLSIVSPAYLLSQTKMFMVVGQSNARGSGDSSLSEIPDSLTAWEYSWQYDSLVPLIDPVGENYQNFQSAVTGSAWTSFAKEFHKITGDSVIIVQCAKGGAPLVTGGFGGYLRWYSLWKAQAAIAHANATLAGVIWLQGESDATDLNSGLISKQDYIDELDAIIEYWRDSLDPQLPFFIVPIGINTAVSDSGFIEIRLAQYQVAVP